MDQSIDSDQEGCRGGQEEETVRNKLRGEGRRGGGERWMDKRREKKEKIFRKPNPIPIE